MRVLFDRELHVHYGFVHLETETGWSDLGASRGGQVNGLCGAANPGALSMITGLHTGLVPLRVEVLTSDPPVGPEWEDVVEVSFTTDGRTLVVRAFGDVEGVQLEAGTYRARYSAQGMDAGRAADTRMEPTPVLDRYLLQLWPAPTAPEQILRQTSEVAAYWHGVARDTPAPPPPPTREELAALAAQEVARQEEERRVVDACLDAETWGGRAPSAALRAAGGQAAQLARLDRDLVDALVGLEPDRQRTLAARAARWACEAAGHGGTEWLLGAVDAVERGDALPPPFDEPGGPWARLHPVPEGTVVTHTATITAVDASRPRPWRPIDPSMAAITAISLGGDPDPARAVLGAVDAAASGQHDRAAFLAEVRTWR